MSANERILFVTGHLAEAPLREVLAVSSEEDSRRWRVETGRDARIVRGTCRSMQFRAVAAFDFDGLDRQKDRRTTMHCARPVRLVLRSPLRVIM